MDIAATSSADTASPPLRILVVDDSEAIRMFMRKRLAMLAGTTALQLETAATGEEAVARCASQPFDLVFLDVVMPGMGGLEACRRLKAEHAMRVAMVSSLRGPEDEAAARAAGCDHYLGKPAQDAELASVLRLVQAAG